MTTTKFCPQCGTGLEPGVQFCPRCGARLYSTNATEVTDTSPKSAVTALLLCMFLGPFGIHRFYVGKIGTGILMLLTAGGLGIWTLIDLIYIACCEFKDKEGRPLVFTRGKKSPLKLALIIIGGILVAIIVYIIVLFAFVFYLLSGLTAPIHSQLSALRNGDFVKAYSYTSNAFQNTVSMVDFKKFVDSYPELKTNKSASFPESEFHNDEGLVKGTLESNDGTKSHVEYHLVKENGTWKILGFKLSPEEENEHNPSTQSSLSNTYQNDDFKFSLKYPENWEYEQLKKNSVRFSGKKGYSSYHTLITIQVVPTKNAGGLYADEKIALDKIKDQISSQATNVKFIDQGMVELPQNPKLYHGSYFVVSYTYQGKDIKKMQFVLTKENGKYFYSWGYTTPADQYSIDLPIAKSMFESWNIE